MDGVTIRLTGYLAFGVLSSIGQKIRFRLPNSLHRPIHASGELGKL